MHEAATMTRTRAGARSAKCAPGRSASGKERLGGRKRTETPEVCVGREAERGSVRPRLFRRRLLRPALARVMRMRRLGECESSNDPREVIGVF
jgi:hypothetical protein